MGPGWWKGSYFLLLPLLAVSSLLLLVVENPYYTDMILMTFFYAAMGMAWNFIGGFCGQLSLGHTVFFGIGGYSAALLFLRLGITPWLGMFAGAGLSALVSYLLGQGRLQAARALFRPGDAGLGGDLLSSLQLL